MAFKGSDPSRATIAAYRTVSWTAHRLAPAAGSRRAALDRWRRWATSAAYAPPVWIHAASVGEGEPFGVFTCWQPVVASQASAVHGFESLQSVTTLQGRQPAIAVCSHPLTGLQVSTVHALWSLQSSA